MSESKIPTTPTTPTTPSSPTSDSCVITLSVYSLLQKTNEPDSLLLLDSYTPDTTLSSVIQHLNFKFSHFLIKQSDNETLSLENTDANLQKPLSLFFLNTITNDKNHELTIYLCPVSESTTENALEEDIVTSGDEEEDEESADDERDNTSDQDSTEDESQLTKPIAPIAPIAQQHQHQPPENQEVKVIVRCSLCSKCNKRFFAYKIHPSSQIYCSSCRGGTNKPDTQLGRTIVSFQQSFIDTQIDQHYEIYLGKMNSHFNSINNAKKRKRFLTKSQFADVIISAKTKGENLVQRAQKLLFQCHLCSESEPLGSLESCFVCHFSFCDKHHDKSTSVCHFCTKNNIRSNNFSQVVAEKLKEHNLLLLEFDQLFVSLS